MNSKKRLPENFLAIRGDIFGGLTAAVVALPLALAFGVASGAGAISGLYGAILVGFFAALFGGTPTQVSGPTGPMTVVMTTIIMQYAHQPSLAFVVVIIGGIIQIMMGKIGWGKFVAYMPYPLISGFMSGIGCIIIILQLPVLLGHPGVKDGLIATLTMLPTLISTLNKEAVLVGFTTVCVILFLPKKIHSVTPPPLVGLIVGSSVGYLFLSGVPTIGEIPRGIPTFLTPDFSLSDLPGLLGSACILATLGTIDSLLTSLVADKLTRTQHNPNRELIGQGIGNIAAGLFGGIPGAGATMRTVVNIKAGARTNFSGILHSLVLAFMLLGLAPIAEQIPLAVLAGILIKVGWDIIDWNYLKRVNLFDLTGLVVMLSVLTMTVLVDLITAVGVGLIIQFLLSSKHREEIEARRIKTFSSLECEHCEFLLADELKMIRDVSKSIGIVELSGINSFCSVKTLANSLSRLSKCDVVIFNLTKLEKLDTSIAMVINDAITFAKENAKEYIIIGINENNKKFLKKLQILNNNDNRIEPSLLNAINRVK